MYIKRLTIDNFGSIIHFDMHLPKTVALIETCDSHSVTSAVRILLMYASIHEIDPPVAAGQCTKLYAEVVAGDLNYQVTSNGIKISAFRINKDSSVEEVTDEYFYAVSCCEEEDRISFLDGSKNGAYYGLERYASEEKFYRAGEFARVTDGMGTTYSFRRCLKEYLNQKTVAATDEDNSAIRFINTVCFWDDFGKIRNMHYDGKPLLVKDASPDIVCSIQEYDRQIGRQKLLISQQKKMRT